MDDTFFGTKSTELRVTGDLQIEGLEVGDDGVERAAFYVGGNVFESTDDEVCAAAEGKGEAMTGEAAAGFEDAVGGRIIGILTASEPMRSREVGKRRSMTRTFLMVNRSYEHPFHESAVMSVVITIYDDYKQYQPCFMID